MATQLVRLEVRRNRKFHVLYLEAAEDPRLSWKAKGLHTFLITRPPGWTISIEALIKCAKDGRDGLLGAVKELELCGYLKIDLDRGARGKIVGKKWTVTESPETLPLLEAIEDAASQDSNRIPENPTMAPGLDSHRIPDLPTTGFAVVGESETNKNQRPRKNQEPNNNQLPLSDSDESSVTSIEDKRPASEEPTTNPNPSVTGKAEPEADSLSIVADRWNSKKSLPTHRAATVRASRSSFKARLAGGFTVDQILLAIDNLAKAIEDPGCWWTNAYTLKEFLSREEGAVLEKFLNGVEQFRRSVPEKPKSQQIARGHGSNPYSGLISGPDPFPEVAE